MTRQRFEQAATLGEILLTAFTKKQSGLLQVERGAGRRKEKGELYLLGGQPIYAQAGKLAGQAALDHLLTWQQVQYLLLPEATRPPANLSARVRISLTGPLSEPAVPPEPRRPDGQELQSPASLPDGGSLTQSMRPPTGYFQSPIRPSIGYFQPPPADPNPQSTSPVRSEERVALRSGREWPEVMAALTRQQRLVYVLIDGQRSLGELARFSGRSPGEIERIVLELKQRDLVIW